TQPLRLAGGVGGGSGVAAGGAVGATAGAPTPPPQVGVGSGPHARPALRAAAEGGVVLGPASAPGAPAGAAPGVSAVGSGGGLFPTHVRVTGGSTSIVARGAHPASPLTIPSTSQRRAPRTPIAPPRTLLRPADGSAVGGTPQA